jgi:hypothetical protein
VLTLCSLAIPRRPISIRQLTDFPFYVCLYNRFRRWRLRRISLPG